MQLFYNALCLSFKLSFKASAIIMIFRLMVLGFEVFIPIINMRTMKDIVDGLTILDAKMTIKGFVVLGVCQIISAIISRTTNYLSTIHSDKIMLIISKDIIETVNNLDISYFENPNLYNELTNVTRDIQTIPTLIWKVLSSVQIIFKFCIVSVIISKYICWTPIMLIISCLPYFVIDKKYSLKMYEWNRDSASEYRKLNYLYDTLTSRYFSKDVRLHNLKKYLLNNYESRWNEWYYKKHKLLSKHFIAAFIAMFFPNIATLVCAGIILFGILEQRFTVGDFSYFINLMGQLTAAVFSMITIASDIITNKMKIEYYNKFKSWESKVDVNGKDKIISIDSIEFENVSFKYPNTDLYVLTDVSFKILKGEKIGIVGKNGSGKTTIVKLLLRFYEPTNGRIMLNGKDIKKYNLEEYYKLISSFMQDYINYSFSLHENIVTAQTDNKNSIDQIFKACELSDAYEFVRKWDKGIEEYLTKSFEQSGQELSGGQWQKISLSRFFYRKADFLIMDEPSSSIDIESEKKIFDNLFKYNKECTLVLISHRLCNLCNFDKIIVLDNGKIIEKGNHQTLIKNRSLYYTLYNIQSEKYK